MGNNSSSNQRIAKNTIFLYFRMIVSIAVSLYTVRVLWTVLGVNDYGIYNLVGGIVLMFAFINTAMVASSQRFISFELGRGDMQQLRRVFSISVTIHFLLALIVLCLAETVGLWFLNEKINIPSERMIAANWVYQCSLTAFLFNVISVPYNSCIVAHEHMKAYGYLSILDIILKLLIVFITDWIPYDRLIIYAILYLLVSAIMRLLYSFYCKKHFEECVFERSGDFSLMKKMFSFAGWSFLGNMGFSVRDYGGNIILNLFYDVSANAAKGIANQVGGAVNSFALSFTMALNPQITKRYAKGEIESMLSLLYNGCKYSLLLVSIVTIPLFISADVVLNLWLGSVAPYTIGFMRLVLLMSLIDCVVSPITTSIQATGRIKKFQIVIFCIMIANLPIVWFLFQIFNTPYIIAFIAIITSAIALICRILMLYELIRFSLCNFFIQVYSRTIPFIIIAGIFSWQIYGFFSPDFMGLVKYSFCSTFITLLLIYIIALQKVERNLIKTFIVKKLTSRWKNIRDEKMSD